MANWQAEGGTVTEEVSEVCKVNPSRPNYRLDARLIAAAPELLSACKAALEHFSRMDRTLQAALGDKNKETEIQTLAQKCADALAKAEGVTPQRP